MAAFGILAAIWTAALPTPARAEEPKFLTLGAGAFDINGSDGAALLSIEYIDRRQWLWKLRPMTGLFATQEASIYGYAGLALDIYFGRRIVLTPSFAPGLYFENGGKDLGSVIEFRSSIKAAYRLDDRSRLGVEFFHISNASIGDRNPGANELLLFYSIPFSSGN